MKLATPLIITLLILTSCQGVYEFSIPQNHPIPTHTEAPTSQENNTDTSFFTTLETKQTSKEAQAFFDTHRNKEQEIIIAILEQDCQGDAQCQHQKESARQAAMEQLFQEKSALETHITHLYNTERAKKASQEDIKRAKSCLETSPLRTNPHTFIVWAFQNPHDTQCYYLGFIENNFFLISNSTPPHPLSHWDEFIG